MARYHANQNVCLYLSDISGAFDRVDIQRLLAKLGDTQLPPELMHFLRSYLAPRTASVVIGGAHSDAYSLVNAIFQGIVPGPTLCNVHTNDVDATVPPGYVINTYGLHRSL